MIYYEFSKAEKNIARPLLEKGLQKEFQHGLEMFESILKEWRKNYSDNRETYHALYKSMETFDKHIGLRYDRMGGSKWAFIIAQQLRDGIISREDIAPFSPASQKFILIMSGIDVEQL